MKAVIEVCRLRKDEAVLAPVNQSINLASSRDGFHTVEGILSLPGPDQSVAARQTMTSHENVGQCRRRAKQTTGRINSTKRLIVARASSRRTANSSETTEAS